MNEGWKTTLRYLRHSKDLWSSDVNDAAITVLDPQMGEVVIDVGAGMGASTFPITRLVGPSDTGRVIVAEPNALLARVIWARRMASGKNRLTIELHVDGFENLPAADDYIDKAIVVNVMHHVDDHAHAASELARVVKPGGLAFLVDQDFGNHHEQHGYTKLDADSLAAELTAAGFASVDTSITTLAGKPVVGVLATR